MSSLDRTQAPAPAGVREFRFPQVERISLANELTVLSARHSDLPVVTLMLVAHAGAEHDERATSGIAQLTARSLEAGTQSRSADRVAWQFELLGAELAVTVVWDCALLAVTVPSANAEPALALLAEIVTAPAFLESEIDRLKGEQLSELEQRKAEPRSLANDMASRFIFAPDVPYSRPIVGMPATVKRLDVDRVRAFYQQHWGAANAALIVVGNLEPDAVAQLATRHLTDWANRAGTNAEFDVASPVERTQIFVVDRQDSVQSELRVGHVGLPRSAPDYFAATVASGVLGGVFTSRLNMSLREKHGFTYGVRSAFGFRKRAGPFSIQTAVESDVTAKALSELLTETRTFVQDGATENEVVAAREYLAGVMPLEMQTTHQMADRLADIFVYNLANDYMPQHRAALLSVSREEASGAARDHIKPDQFAISIIGDAKSSENELARLDLGPIEVHSPNE
ncbi:MAG: M16 family metallopeptidase [Gemmatimonadota bacterium]